MKKMKSKTFSILLAILLVGAIGAGATFAFRVTGAKDVINNFIPGNPDVDTTIPETIPEVPVDPKDPVQKEVKVLNSGEAPVYIRARVSVSPEELLASDPAEATDSQITISGTSSQWVKSGSYYYYTEAVAPGEATDYLMKEVTIGPLVSTDFDITIYEETVIANAVAVPDGATAAQIAEAVQAAFDAVDAAN